MSTAWMRTSGRSSSSSPPYFPYGAKLLINGHHYAQAQAAKAGIGFTALDNGFAACDDPAAVQAICDALTEDTIEALARKWPAVLPNPYSAADQAAGYRYDISVLQAEFSLTQVLDKPVSGRIFSGQATADNLGIWPARPGRPDLRPPHRPQGPARHPGPVPHPGHHQRGHPEPARALQARPDQAVPQLSLASTGVSSTSSTSVLTCPDSGSSVVISCPVHDAVQGGDDARASGGDPRFGDPIVDRAV